MSKFERWWIWFWYNDITRLVFVALGGNLLITIPILMYLGVAGEVLRQIVLAQYILVMFWAVADNNYSNLRKIGLDEYRRPLNKETK